jgi:protein-tyrosine phosphatase
MRIEAGQRVTYDPNHEHLLRFGIDAHRIAPKLWQGSKPPRGLSLFTAGFDVLVLCAEEHQPWEADFPGVEVIRAPNDDSGKPMTKAQLKTADREARRVAKRLRQGRRVLVTCAMGLNRSGLVSALALHYRDGLPGRACIEIVQKARPGALRNPEFVRALAALPALSIAARRDILASR